MAEVETAPAEAEANGQPPTFKYGKRVFKIPHLEMAPSLSKEEEQQLEKSLKEHGVVTPVIVTEDDTVLHGHNRLFKSAKLGIPLKDIPIQVRKGTITHEEQEELVVVANFVGRKVTPERRAHMSHFLRGRGYSARRIADLLGCYHTTVLEDLQKPDPLAPEGAAAKPAPQPTKVTGRDGKQHPAKKPVRKQAPQQFFRAPDGTETTITPTQKQKIKLNCRAAVDALRVLQRLLDRVGLGDKHKAALEAILAEVRAVV